MFACLFIIIEFSKSLQTLFVTTLVTVLRRSTPLPPYHTWSHFFIIFTFKDCVCLFLYLIDEGRSEGQSVHFTNKVRTFWLVSGGLRVWLISGLGLGL